MYNVKSKENIIAMLKLFTTFFFLLSFSHTGLSEYYKVVDENGKVTYTERLPMDPSKAAQVEKMKMSVTSNYKVAVKKIGAMEYCGEIELPNMYESSDLSSYTQYSNVVIDVDGRTVRLPEERPQAIRSNTSHLLEEIASKYRGWQKSLDQLESQIENENRILFERNARKGKYRTPSASEHRYRNAANMRIKEKLSDVRELRCALSWADEQKEKISQENIANVEEIKRLEEIIGKLEEKMYRVCGSKPVFDPSRYRNNEHNENWEKCVNPHLADIYKVEGRIRSHMSSYKGTQYLD